MIDAGRAYQPSGKYNKTQLMIALFTLGIVLSGGLGAFYAYMMSINPFPVLNFIFLIILVLTLMVVISLVQNISKSRSVAANVVIAIVCCLAAYYTHWAVYLKLSPFDIKSVISKSLDYMFNHPVQLSKQNGDFFILSQLVSKLIYLTEAIGFFSVIFIATEPDIYCESCQRFNHTFRLYTIENKKFITDVEKSTPGHYIFVKNKQYVNSKLILLNTLAKGKAGQTTMASEYLYSQCLKCRQNGFLSLNILTFEKAQHTKKARQSLLDNRLNNIKIDEQTTAILEHCVKEAYNG